MSGTIREARAAVQITVRPHELEPGDIIVDPQHLGQRVGGYDPPSLLLYDGQWHVWSSLDKKICTLPADATVEVLRVPHDVDGEGLSDRAASPSATLDDCPPRGITRVRGLLQVVR